jgi:hypothetical protein
MASPFKMMLKMNNGAVYDIRNLVNGKWMVSMPVVVTTTTTSVTNTPNVTNTASVTDTKPNGMEIPTGKSGVSFENLSSAEMVIDIIASPPIDAQVLAPKARPSFVLEPGSYKFNAAAPGGAYATSGEFVVGPNQWAEIVIFGNTNNIVIHDGSIITPAVPPLNPTADKGLWEIARIVLSNQYGAEYQVDFGDGTGSHAVVYKSYNNTHYLNPGTYNLVLTSALGGPAVTETITVAAGESWSIFVDYNGSILIKKWR